MTKEQAWNKHNATLLTDYAAFAAGWDAALASLATEDDKVPVKAIIDACNDILGKKFGSTGANAARIRARWKEGKRQADFEAVCRIKQDQWDSDPRMRPYLRPETLFGTKMDSYLNEETTKSRQVEPSWL